MARAMGVKGRGQGEPYRHNYLRKAENLEVASTLCLATSQHSGLARTATPDAKAERAGIYTVTHRGRK